MNCTRLSDRPALTEDAIAARLAALSHPARLAILRHLSARRLLLLQGCGRYVDLAQSTVSQHLKVLVEAGLVRYAPDRQRSRYEIDRARGRVAVEGRWRPSRFLLRQL